MESLKYLVLDRVIEIYCAVMVREDCTNFKYYVCCYVNIFTNYLRYCIIVLVVQIHYFELLFTERYMQFNNALYYIIVLIH
jgi:hypothetical protein